MARATPSKAVTMTGILTPLRWSSDGKTTAVALATAAERDFEIASESLTVEVFSHLRELVRIRGVVRDKAPGRPTLAVEAIEVLERPSSWNGWDHSGAETCRTGPGRYGPRGNADRDDKAG